MRSASPSRSTSASAATSTSAPAFSDAAASRALATLRALEPASPDQAQAQRHAIDHLAERGAAALSRSIPEHLTGSTIVFDAGLTSTLLCYHRKGRFWVQPGGHTDAEDEDLLAGALRELREETGLGRFVVPSVAPADIDRHALGGGFGACAWHIDVGFVVVADPGDPVVVSPESADVAWWPVDALPADRADGLGARIERARAFARLHAAPGGPAAPGGFSPPRGPAAPGGPLAPEAG